MIHFCSPLEPFYLHFHDFLLSPAVFWRSPNPKPCFDTPESLEAEFSIPTIFPHACLLNVFCSPFIVSPRTKKNLTSLPVSQKLLLGNYMHQLLDKWLMFCVICFRLWGSLWKSSVVALDSLTVLMGRFDYRNQPAITIQARESACS